MSSLNYLAISFTVVIALTQGTLICNDIDPAACKLLAQSKPNLCSDISLATSTCPRFCNLCPVECYNCNNAVTDYRLCNTTTPCADGQVCMLKELQSYHDGHREYEMSCADKQDCDGGPGLTVPFGKRSVASRDLSITCCGNDLCNYPAVTGSQTGTGCSKDIFFLIDGTSSVVRNEHLTLVTLLLAIAKRLDIGTNDNLMAVYNYDQDIHVQIDLQQNTDESSLISAIQYTNLKGSGFRSDTEQAIEDMINLVMTPKSGDRPRFQDAVILVTDSSTAQRVHLGALDQSKLSGASHDVIVLSVGQQSGAGTSGESSVATDQNHIIHVDSLGGLGSIVDSLVPLLKQC